MSRPGFLLLMLLLARNPAVVLHYSLTVDSANLSGYDVAITIQHAPRRFHLAMATHHEYDDRYWRFITGLHVSPPATITREDSAVWTVTTPGGDVRVTYHITLPHPPPIHFAHRPFLAPYGGLVGDLHSFLYLVENPYAPCHLMLHLPRSWTSASGLDPVSTLTASQPSPVFPAATAPQLLDDPILIGHLHRWHFTVGGIPHEVVYLPATTGLSFDTVALVAGIKKIVTAAKDIFRRFPYEHYTFLLEDASAGALEHHNSVTIGATAADLQKQDLYEEIAHEFFHTWDLLAIHPSGYTDLNYGTQQQSRGLWFSEGVTMLYADLICRRIGLPTEDSTRIAHLTSLITRYYSDTGNAVLPPHQVSLASNVQPGPLGDYDASTHLQGELLGDCMDILIRNATDGRHSIDDLMREIYDRSERPITDSDIETAATNVCHCSQAHTFFQAYLQKGQPINFAACLKPLGLRIQHDQPPATDSQGRPLPDTRVYTWVRRDDTSLRIGILNPNSCWGRAGLHTGDIILYTREGFRAALRTLHIGDTQHIIVKKETGTQRIPVYITGYTTPRIILTRDPAATPKQRRLLQQWAAGQPQ